MAHLLYSHFLFLTIQHIPYLADPSRDMGLGLTTFFSLCAVDAPLRSSLPLQSIVFPSRGFWREHSSPHRCPRRVGPDPKTMPPMLQVFRWLQVDHKIPETWKQCWRSRGLPHFQEEHWRRFPALRISLVKSQQICLAMTEERRHTAHSHNEQEQWDSRGGRSSSVSQDQAMTFETAQDGNISYESLLVLCSVKKIIMSFRNLGAVQWKHTSISRKGLSYSHKPHFI